MASREARACYSYCTVSLAAIPNCTKSTTPHYLTVYTTTAISNTKRDIHHLTFLNFDLRLAEQKLHNLPSYPGFLSGSRALGPSNSIKLLLWKRRLLKTPVDVFTVQGRPLVTLASGKERLLCNNYLEQKTHISGLYFRMVHGLYQRFQ